jgi:virulence factor Mce-like protein
MDEEEKPGGLRGAAGWLLDNPFAIVLVVVLVVVVVLGVRSRHQPHELNAVFTTAPNLYPGLDVRLDGLDAGKIKKVTYDGGHAIVKLGIYDDVWPLRQGTTATLRFGTTIGNGTRIIDLNPSTSGPEIPENGVIPNGDTVEATEFDDVFNVFNGDTRKALRKTLKGTAATFGGRKDQISAAVRTTAPGLQSISGFTRDIVDDEPALRALVANGYRVTKPLAARHDQIADVLDVASQTFRAFAANTNNIKTDLDEFPGTLRDAKATLARLDHSVDGLDSLMADLAPGARQLRPLAIQLRPALANLRRTAPVAVATLRAGRSASPKLAELLKVAQPFSAKAAPALTELSPMVGCIRPYAPEIAALLTQWSSWTQYYDGVGRVGRVWANAGLAGPTIYPKAITSEKFTKLLGALQTYAMIRPPGYNAGQPFFLPECGAGPDGIDASKDPPNPPPAHVEQGPVPPLTKSRSKR